MPKMSHIEITRLQGGLAIASFVSGVVIAMVCLFWIEPLGEITYSAISIVSELLVLCGAIYRFDPIYRYLSVLRSVA